MLKINLICLDFQVIFVRVNEKSRFKRLIWCKSFSKQAFWLRFFKIFSLLLSIFRLDQWRLCKIHFSSSRLISGSISSNSSSNPSFPRIYELLIINFQKCHFFQLHFQKHQFCPSNGAIQGKYARKSGKIAPFRAFQTILEDFLRFVDFGHFDHFSRYLSQISLDYVILDFFKAGIHQANIFIISSNFSHIQALISSNNKIEAIKHSSAVFGISACPTKKFQRIYAAHKIISNGGKGENTSYTTSFFQISSNQALPPISHCY